MAVELRREVVEAELLDPREGFRPTRTRLEIRFDPLTGHGCRLLPAGSFPAPAPIDVSALAGRTRPECPFCPERIEDVTPRFPPKLVPGGRITCGEAVLFPNLVPYAKWSAVSVYSPARHSLTLEELTPRLLADNLAVQAVFAATVRAHDRDAGWVSVNANHLPPAGSSVFHPHLQGSVNPTPTTMQRLLADVEPGRVDGYVAAERELGERFIASTGAFDWIAAFAPVGPGEVRAFAAGAGALGREVVDELALGIAAVLRTYARLGFQSFNLALGGPPPGMPGAPVWVRLVARAYYGAAERSDAMWSERLHWEAAVDVEPELLAQLAREAWR